MTKAAITLSALSYLFYLWQMINVGRHQYHSNSGPPQSTFDECNSWQFRYLLFTCTQCWCHPSPTPWEVCYHLPHLAMVGDAQSLPSLIREATPRATVMWPLIINRGPTYTQTALVPFIISSSYTMHQLDYQLCPATQKVIK